LISTFLLTEFDVILYTNSTMFKDVAKKVITYFLSVQIGMMVIFPSSTNYTLESYEFGGGAGAGASSNYLLEGVLGEQTSNDASSAGYTIGSGLLFVQQANVPTIFLTNDADWYNKLKVVLGEQNNPTDTVYAIAISTDNFSTTNYVQSDGTVGAILGQEDYLTYAGWGGASGSTIIGLTSGTTYQVKAKARQGDFSESPYGPVSSAATSTSSLVFDIDVASTDTESAAPYNLSVGSLTAGNVTTATNKVWVDIATNAEGGGYVYIAGEYGGLRSTNLNYTISSSSTDLTIAQEGYGIQNSSTAAASGTLTSLSPYNNTSENVGVVDSTIRELYNSTAAPISGGRGSFVVKAKVSATTPSSNDYSETLTIIASGTF